MIRVHSLLIYAVSTPEEAKSVFSANNPSLNPEEWKFKMVNLDIAAAEPVDKRPFYSLSPSHFYKWVDTP